MEATVFENYKKGLIEDIRSSKDFDDLNEKIIEATWDLSGEAHEISEEAMAAILDKSHEQALEGQTYSMKEIENFMNQKVYELT